VKLTDRILGILADGPATSLEIRALIPDVKPETVMATIGNMKMRGRIEVGGIRKRQGKGGVTRLYLLKTALKIEEQAQPTKDETPLPANGEYRIAGRITVRQIVFPGSRLGHKHHGML
jgi:hypothetical protein